MSKRIVVEVIGDVDQFQRQMKAAGRQVDTFGSKLNHVTNMAGLAAGAAGIGGLAYALKTGISEWTESTKVAAQTAAVIKSTGGIANVTAGHVDRLSLALMKKTGVDDELVKTSENLLLTFKNVRNELGAGNAIFDRATKGALDLSRSGFGSVESASKMLGKALNDPVRGMTALGRAGVTFTAAQKETIKQLVETGHTLEAQKLIMKEVESQVGGSAVAYGKTLPGQLKILRETFNNLAGDIVAKLAPSLERGAKALSEWLNKAENQKRVMRDLTAAGKAVAAVVAAITGAMRTLLPIVQKVVEALGGLRTVVIGLIGLKVALMFNGWGTAAAGAAGSVTKLGIAFSSLGPAIAVATAAYIAFRVAKDTFEGDIAGGPGDNIPFTGPRNVQPGGTQAGKGNVGLGVAAYATAYGPDTGHVYVTGGTKPETGYDCSGFVYAAYKAAGVDIPRTSEGQWYDNSAHCVHVPKGKEKPGDGVYFAAVGNGYKPPGHCGIYSGNGYFIEYYSGGKPARYSKLAERSDYWGARRWVKIEQQGSESGKKGSGGAGAGGGGGAITQTVAGGIAMVKKTLAAAAALPGGTKTKRGTYSYTQLRSLWAANGGDPVVADIAAAVAVAESGGKSWAIGKNKNGSIDMGCWQINSVHGYDAARLLDGDQSFNAQCAVAIHSSQGFNAWTMYRNGEYLKYMHGNHSPKSSGVAAASVEGNQTIADSQKSRAQKAKDAAIASLAAGTALAAKLAKQRGVDPTTVYGPWAHPHARAGGVKAITGDALVPPALAARLTGLMDKFKGLAAAAGVLTGKAAEGAQIELLANIQDQRDVLLDEAAALKARLQRSTGKQRTAIADEIANITGRLSDVNDQILSALQGSVQTAQGRFSSVFDKVRARMTAQFEAQTQGMLDRLGVKFFQGGALTPAEQALKAWTDARSQKSLQQAVSDAQAQWAKAVTPEEKQAARDALTAAKDAIEQDRLEAAATAERTVADKAYAEQSAKLQADRAAKEQEMNDRLDAFIEGVLNGTVSVEELGAIAGEFGVTADMVDLSAAAGSLADAFRALADFIDVIMGNAPGSHPGGSGNPTAPGGDSWWTKTSWWAPGLATTGAGAPPAWMVKPKPGGTLVRLAEAGHPEIVSRGGYGGGVRIDNVTIQTTVPPSDARRWIRDNGPAIKDELERVLTAGR